MRHIELEASKQQPKLKFLAKAKRTRLFAAAFVVILTLVSIVYIYCVEYPLTGDRNTLSAAITDYISYKVDDEDITIDAYVLETMEAGRDLIAFFRDRNDSQVFGFAYFEKGLNTYYQITGYTMAPIPYSASVIVCALDDENLRSGSFKGGNLLIGGYNCEGIHSYGIQFAGDYHKDIAAKAILPMENGQFFTKVSLNEVYEQAGFSPEQLRSIKQILPACLLYDENGNDISENYFLADVDANWGGGGSTPIYVYYLVMLLVLILGIIFTRYFLT